MLRDILRLHGSVTWLGRHISKAAWGFMLVRTFARKNFRLCLARIGTQALTRTQAFANLARRFAAAASRFSGR